MADRLPTVLLPLAAVGSTALTAYAGGIVATWVTSAPDYETNRPWLVYVLITIAAATVWRLFLGRGPATRTAASGSTPRFHREARMVS